jgi:hypothetical protein
VPSGDPRPPDLKRLAAIQVATCLEGKAVGESLPLDSSSDLCGTLELLIPAVLRLTHSEWAEESIDGFFFSSAVRGFEHSAEIVGTCILISDQTVTPFALDVALEDAETFRSFRIRLGERGRGPLGISGPKCTSDAALEMLHALNARLDQIAWVYDLAL